MNIFQEISNRKDLTDTEKTIAKLRAVADALESIKDKMPSISWYRLAHWRICPTTAHSRPMSV